MKARPIARGGSKLVSHCDLCLSSDGACRRIALLNFYMHILQSLQGSQLIVLLNLRLELHSTDEYKCMISWQHLFSWNSNVKIEIERERERGHGGGEVDREREKGR